ncbi:MAG: aroK [Acidimicrobiales bacterium]|jgi:shikimate kinase|nr:aroK [Acidimicrobiales bacterium]
MGAGKSTVGRLLAKRLDRPFVDTDAMVEDGEGTTVAEVFSMLGEPAFRMLEADAVRDALGSPLLSVVAVGGGAVVDPENRVRLSTAGHVVWLRARPETLAARVGAGAGRPLLVSSPAESLTRLAAERDAAYREVAALIVDVDDLTAVDVVDRVVAGLAG